MNVNTAGLVLHVQWKHIKRESRCNFPLTECHANIKAQISVNYSKYWDDFNIHLIAGTGNSFD